MVQITRNSVELRVENVMGTVETSGHGKSKYIDLNILKTRGNIFKIEIRESSNMKAYIILFYINGDCIARGVLQKQSYNEPWHSSLLLASINVTSGMTRIEASEYE